MLNVLSIRALAHVKPSNPDSYEELRRRLTVHNKFKKFSLELFREGDDGTLYIPRALVKGTVEDAGWQKCEFQSSISLTQQQTEIVNAFFNHLESNPFGGIISAGTGTGKTIMGLYIIAKLGYKALVIVPTDRIFHQWVERCKTFLGFTPSLIRGALCEYDMPLTVAMLHTIRKEKFNFLEKEFGVVVYDEIHTIATEYFHVVASKFWDKIRLGLSATPYRKDGMAGAFLWHIGDVVKFTNAPVNVVPKVVVVNYYNPESYHGACIIRGELSFGRYLNKLIAISHRNKIIAKYIKLAYEKDHDILVLTERLQHIDTLIRLSEIPKKDIGKLTATQKEIDKKVIFGTYGSAGLGLDIPRLSCIILATPRADIVQAVGRVLRAKHRKPLVIDFIDEASFIMRKWFEKRKKYYSKLQSDIYFIKESV